MVPLWALSPIRSDGGAFTEFFNGGGWNTTGLSVMVGLLPVALSLLGLDCSVHMGKASVFAESMLTPYSGRNPRLLKNTANVADIWILRECVPRHVCCPHHVSLSRSS
jgi:hypothetical protein